MSNTKELYYDWVGGNEVIFLGINNIRDPYYDKCMQWISLLGDHKYFPFHLGVFAAIALFTIALKAIRNKKGLWNFTTIWVGVFAVLLIGYVAVGLTTKTLKEYYSYPRPYIALASAPQTVYKLETDDPVEDFRSFPSGHAAFTTLIVVAFWPILPNFLAWCGILFIGLVCWSRISLGMHFPADVLASVFITVPLIMLVRSITYFLLRKVFRIKC